MLTVTIRAFIGASVVIVDTQHGQGFARRHELTWHEFVLACKTQTDDFSVRVDTLCDLALVRV